MIIQNTAMKCLLVFGYEPIVYFRSFGRSSLLLSQQPTSPSEMRRYGWSCGRQSAENGLVIEHNRMLTSIHNILEILHLAIRTEFILAGTIAVGRNYEDGTRRLHLRVSCVSRYPPLREQLLPMISNFAISCNVCLVRAQNSPLNLQIL
jgi:hypothetical protein